MFGPSVALFMCLSFLTVGRRDPSLPPVRVFDDRTLYYARRTPTASVMNPTIGTQIRIASISALGGFMQVEVRSAK